MRPTFRLGTSLSIAFCLLTPAAFAQEAPELPKPSPMSRVEQRVGVADFAVEYSSPGVKEREIWGDLVPYDELWRTGANMATKFEASHGFTFGGQQVEAGTYSLFTVPGKDSWKVILNSNAESPGTRGYDEKNNVAEVKVAPEGAPFRERMTFVFSNTTDDATRLDLEWDELRISVALSVDTAAQAAANIDEALGDLWRPHYASARYLLDSDGDLDQALRYIDTSIAIESTWWNQWYRARILAAKNRTSEAVAAATQAQALGEGDEIFESFFAKRVAEAIEDWK